MKKLLFSLLASSALAGSVQAQFNKTHTLPGFNLSAVSIARLPSDGRLFYAGSTGTIGTGYTDSFSVVRTDPNGTFQIGIRFPLRTSFYHLTNTLDNGLMLAAVGDRPGGPWGLNVMKFDLNLNLIWSATLPHIGSFMEVASFVDIEKTTNTVTGAAEYYILSSDDKINGSYTIALTKMSAAGALIWRKLYFPNVADNIDNAPRALTSYRDPVTNALRIVMHGTRRTPSDGSPAMFYMTVDDSGNPVVPYHIVSGIAASPLFFGDVEFDGQNLVSVFEQRNSGFAPPTAASVIGFVKLDTNFNPLLGKVFWADCENYGYGITVAPNGNYVLSGWVTPCSASTTTANPFFMELRRATAVPVYFKRYNNQRNSSSGIRHITDANGNHYKVNPITDPTVPQVLARVMKVNALGITCGSADYPVGSVEYTPSSVALNYGQTTHNIVAGLPLSIMPIHLTQTDCTASSKPDSYRLTEEEQQQDVSITPSLLHSSSDKVTCSVPAATEGSIAAIAVYNMMGQLLYHQDYTLRAGDNKLELPAVFVSGLSIVNVSVNGKVVKVQKVNLVQ